MLHKTKRHNHLTVQKLVGWIEFNYAPLWGCYKGFCEMSVLTSLLLVQSVKLSLASREPEACWCV